MLTDPADTVPEPGHELLAIEAVVGNESVGLQPSPGFHDWRHGPSNGLAQIEAELPQLAVVVNRGSDAFEADPTLTRCVPVATPASPHGRGDSSFAEVTADVLVLRNDSPDPDLTIWHVGTPLFR